MTRLADRNPEGEDLKGLRAEHESGGAAEQQAPNSLFLQPNIDHAVGGEEAACERCQGNGEIITDWNRYMHGEQGDKGDEAVAECPDCDGTGSLATPPVKLDAVREALVAVAGAMLTGGDGAVGEFGWNITRLNKARPLILAALATPSTDTGLDPATKGL